MNIREGWYKNKGLQKMKMLKLNYFIVFNFQKGKLKHQV